MPSREQESQLFRKCLRVATAQNSHADRFDLLDAEAFAVASKLVRYSYPAASTRLSEVSNFVFLSLNNTPSSVDFLLKANAIPLLPRFRSMLEVLLKDAQK